jgi:2-dehydro-3-deoxy-D-pentonate aldolase
VLREVKPGQPGFSVLAGFEDLILPSILAGGDGSICGLANVAPELFVGLVRRARNGELEEAAERHRRVLSLLALGGLGDTPLGAIKLAMNVLGVPISPTVRGPALALGAGGREDVEAILDGAGVGPRR